MKKEFYKGRWWAWYEFDDAFNVGTDLMESEAEASALEATVRGNSFVSRDGSKSANMADMEDDLSMPPNLVIAMCGFLEIPAPPSAYDA